MKKRILFFLIIFSSFSCSSKQIIPEKEWLPDKIANIVSIYYNYYYCYPKDINTIYTFLENHCDYDSVFKENFQGTIEFLKKNEENTFITSDTDLFFLFVEKKQLYVKLRNELCTEILNPDLSLRYLYQFNFYNNSGQNLKEVLGVNKNELFGKELIEELRTIKPKYNDYRLSVLPTDTFKTVYSVKYIRHMGLFELCRNVVNININVIRFTKNSN